MGPPGASTKESLKEKSLKDGLSNSMANKGWGFPTQGLAADQVVLPRARRQ